MNPPYMFVESPYAVAACKPCASPFDPKICHYNHYTSFFSVNFWKSAPNIKKWTKPTLLEGPKVPFFLPPVRPTGDFDVPPAPGEVQDWEDKTGPWSLIYQIYQPNPTSISKKSQTSSTTHLQLRRENQGKTYESYDHMHAAWSVSIFFVWLKRCIQPGMVPTASLLQRHLLHHQDSFRIQGITLRLGWSHLLSGDGAYLGLFVL